MIETPLPYRIDLDKGIKKTYLDTLFATEDNQAHRFDIDINRGGVAATFGSGAAVSAYFIRYCDNGTLAMKGTMSGNVASVTLDKTCYNKAGAFALVIKVTDSGATSTVFYGEGSMLVSRTDTLIDTENVVPSLSDLLAQIEVMELGTQDANEATERANTATENAITATQNAVYAAETANAAAGKVDRLTIDAIALDTAQEPTASVETVDGHIAIHLGLPRGLTGKTPQITFEVTTGDPGTEAAVTVSGTAESPHLLLTIPRGDTGSIGSLTINGKAPSDDGAVTLTAEDIGARTDTWMPNAQDVGGISIVKLWQNESTESSIEGNTKIQIDGIVGFSGIIIVYGLKTTTGNSITLRSEHIPYVQGFKTVLYSLLGTNNAQRSVTLESDGILIGTGYYITTNGSNVGNNHCIPYAIYGVNGVNSINV